MAIQAPLFFLLTLRRHFETSNHKVRDLVHVSDKMLLYRVSKKRVRVLHNTSISQSILLQSQQNWTIFLLTLHPYSSIIWCIKVYSNNSQTTQLASHTSNSFAFVILSFFVENTVYAWPHHLSWIHCIDFVESLVTFPGVHGPKNHLNILNYFCGSKVKILVFNVTWKLLLLLEMFKKSDTFPILIDASF